MIEIKDEALIINGKKEFIYGGELHYFRTPKKNWPLLVKKIKEAGCNLISTYVPWCWHEFEEGKFDFNGNTIEERDLVSFLELLKSENMYCIVRPGPYVMSEIKLEGMPKWLIESYPEVIAKDQFGKDHPTKVVSYMHPTYLKKVQQWYEKVCGIFKNYQITKGANIIMLQLDNEVGMLQWVNNQADFNKAALEYFKHYLENKYEDINTFNNEYGTNCLDFQAFINEDMFKDNKHYALRLSRDYSDFMRGYFEKYIAEIKSYAVKNGIDVPFIVNVHGFITVENTGRGTTYPIGLSQLYKISKMENVVLAGDYYIRNITYDNYYDLIIANAFTKAIQSEGKPLFSAEFQSGALTDRPRLQPSDIDLSTRICIGSGMNAINYYMFSSGENYDDIGLFGKRHQWQAPLKENGEERPHYSKIKYLGSLFKSWSEEILDTKKSIDTYIGFYADYYMTEYNNKNTEEIINKIVEFREKFQFDGILRSLSLSNISFEAIDVMEKQNIDPNKVKSLWMFSTEWMDEHIQRKLVDYVLSGGNLILYPQIPVYDMSGKKCTLLKDAIDVEIKESKKGWIRLNVLGIDSVFANYRLVFDKFNGKPIAWYDEEGEKEVAAFAKQLGKGNVLVFGIGMEHEYDYKIDVIKKLAENLGINTDIYCSDKWTSVLIRENQEKAFIFINNFDEIDKNINLQYKNEDIFNGNNIHVPARSGLMLPVNCSINEDIKVIYSTLEISSFEFTQLGVKICCASKAGINGYMRIESDNYRINEKENIKIKKHQSKVVDITIESKADVTEIEFIREK